MKSCLIFILITKREMAIKRIKKAKKVKKVSEVSKVSNEGVIDKVLNDMDKGTEDKVENKEGSTKKSKDGYLS